MKYIVYKTINILNDHYYIGVHKLNNTKYLGSGVVLKQAIKKYGKSNFIQETLKEFDNKKDAFEYERLLVTQELVENPSCYNICEGGYGGNPPNHTGKKRSQETKLRMSQKHADVSGSNNPMFNKKHSDISKKTLSIKGEGSNNPMFGVCGKDAPRAKSCIINGVKYDTILEASESLDKQRATIRAWCNNPLKTECYFA